MHDEELHGEIADLDMRIFGSASLTFKNDVVVSKLVLVTDCKIKPEAGVKIGDAVIATSITSAQ